MVMAMASRCRFWRGGSFLFPRCRHTRSRYCVVFHTRRRYCGFGFLQFLSLIYVIIPSGTQNLRSVE
jgi:hypothetical protein